MRSARNDGGRRLAAMTLIEVVFAFGILVVALLAFLSFVLAGQASEQRQNERALAQRLAHSTLAELRTLFRDTPPEPDTGFDLVQDRVAVLNGPEGEGSPVNLLRGNDSGDLGVSGGLAGTIRVELILTESVAEAAPPVGLGLTAVDIDGDGVTGSPEPLADDVTPIILPVRVHVVWRGRGGEEQTETLSTLLY